LKCFYSFLFFSLAIFMLGKRESFNGARIFER